MTIVIKQAVDALLSPSGIGQPDLNKILHQAMGHGIDYADLFLQLVEEESWELEDGLVKEGAFDTKRGFGLRVLSGEKKGLAYGDVIDASALLHAASSIKHLAHARGQLHVSPVVCQQPTWVYPSINPMMSVSVPDKVNFLKELDVYARAQDSGIKQVMIQLSAQYEVVLMMNYKGELVSDVRPSVKLWVKVIIDAQGHFDSGSGGMGLRSGYPALMKQAKSCVDKVVLQAQHNVIADPMPAGSMPVVLGPGWPAVLLHEAVGHGLEGDFNRKGSSAFSGRLGEVVASPLCSIVDDGTIALGMGSLNVDDEGNVSQKTMLIENGVLKNYMQDRHNAALMNTVSTGNGRRESYAHLPIPRMTNTYMLPGEHDPEEMIASVTKGLYAVDFSGGQVDITSGQFVFSTREAYLIENGKITRPVKGATLIGNGPEVLKQVSMVGNDLTLDSGLGMCGKAGQSVPVGVGQPTLKVDQLVVGGVALST